MHQLASFSIAPGESGAKYAPQVALNVPYHLDEDIARQGSTPRSGQRGGKTMWQTNEGGVRLGLERLKWALTYPKRSTHDDWNGRLRRALAFLQNAWSEHTTFSNSEFSQIFDPELLPFTALSQQLLDLRREHLSLTAQLAALVKQSWGCRRPDLLCRRTEQLLGAIDRHLAAEQALACD
jgi:hypothetical protein